jgi:hypothetical protein
MPRRRRARSNLYQVDFIAALFGAFLLLWISKPTGSPSEPETAVVVMETSCVNKQYSASFLPKEAKRCIGEDVLQLTDPSLNLKACAFKPAIFDPSWSWDQRGPLAVLAPLRLSTKATGRGDFVKFSFSGLAIVDADPPGHKFRAVGYGSSTPPDQVSGATYAGWIAANVCQKSSCPLHYQEISPSIKEQCTIRLYSSAWPTTCLTTAVETGNAATSFDLKPCGS